ncbi:extracellular solute-binding protein [Paenibacillus barcinonensis]|uniref:Aldotetraouronic acid ABC transporter substrate-binding protein /aldotetraouronic acid ABC transporter substrate-binding protein n=1 Tax=Paenibacillus barcinonensis TaxID=198119 RepID=A0A2V4VGX4_PAEBA|nr:extracellular solute-binding protein [Paenibacillus barcinonensis]PYE45442.1 aldotetraouronic acid ABC transporter substrate-binding protein /aldotetraouronic acid ABC transporter substrate-binding protein [Paenibacillus barcinonensis]QKS55257.1 extracellular solute-binding protein [Paenibacillus barcinonensis]
MLKAWKKPLSVLMAATMLSGVLAACSSDTASGPDPKSTNSNEFYSAPFENGKYTEPVTISTVFPITSSLKFKNGENIENNVHTKWAHDTLGIDIKYLWTVSDQNNAYQTKLRLMLTSGQKMPDIISFRGDSTLISDLIESGQFTDAGELFDKYASDVYKKAMAEDPNVWKPYVRDGKRMAIPILENAYNNDPVMYIREDWLKKLNLKAPTTLAELETVMDAFVNQDPDGNGKKDTTALSVGFKNYLNTWMSDSSWIFGMFGAMPGQWNKAADGTLAYGSIQPEMKPALAKMKEWMDKGYIDKEAGLYDEPKAAEAFTAGKSGIIVGPYWMTGWPIPDLQKNVPDAEYKAYPLPAGPDGKMGRHGTRISTGAVLINKDMEHKDAFFVYQNYLFDHWANPDSTTFVNGFAKGYDYDIAPDGTVYKELQSDKIPGGWIDAIRYTLTFDGAIIPNLMMNTLAELAGGKEPTTQYEKNLADRIPEQIKAAKIVIDQKDIVMPQMFTGVPTKTQVSRGDMLSKLEKEVLNKIIYGQSPVDEFDTFVEQYMSSGGKQITEEVNEWYNTVK